MDNQKERKKKREEREDRRETHKCANGNMRTWRMGSKVRTEYAKSERIKGKSEARADRQEHVRQKSASKPNQQEQRQQEQRKQTA